MLLGFASFLVLAVEVAAAGDTEPPQIVHQPCAEYARGDSFDIWARFYDASQIFDPKVIYRLGKGSWKSLPLKRADAEAFKATLRAKQMRGVLEYFIEVFDEHGNGPARFGSPEQPIEVKPVKSAAACLQVPSAVVAAPAASGTVVAPSGEAGTVSEEVAASPVDGPSDGGGVNPGLLTVQPPPPAATGCSALDPPLYCSPWLWVGVAVGLGAAGGVVYYVATRQQPSQPTAGDVMVSVTGAPPAVAP